MPRGSVLTKDVTGAAEFPLMQQKLAALDQLYAELPHLECKGLCQEVCGIIPATKPEQWRIMGLLGRAPVQLSPECPLLVDGRCSVYQHRPLICRLWGMVEDDDRMRCKYGCVPDRWLTAKEAHEYLARAEEIADA